MVGFITIMMLSNSGMFFSLVKAYTKREVDMALVESAIATMKESLKEIKAEQDEIRRDIHAAFKRLN